MTRGRWLVLGVVGAAVLFGLQAGEYSTWEWLALRREERGERERIRELKRELDSLLRYAKLVETDPETQERIAREQYGMLKAGEHAFIFVPSDSEP